MTGVAIKLPRGGVIAGTVADENGLPAFGVQVRVLQYRVVQGERTLAPVQTANLLGEVTDDRGTYRIFGLPPGEYIVSATPRNAMTGEIRAMTEAEIRAALVALQQPAGPNPRCRPAARWRRRWRRRRRPHHNDRDNVPTVGFAAVYYPGTTAGARP